MPRRIPCAGPGCTARVDAAHKSGLCRARLDATHRRPEPVRTPPRWPVRVALVPQATNIQHDDYRYARVTLPAEPQWRTL